MDKFSQLRVQRDALEQKLCELERATERQHLRLASVAGKARPDLAEQTAALLLRLGLVNDALTALHGAHHHRPGDADVAAVLDEAQRQCRHARRLQ